MYLTYSPGSAVAVTRLPTSSYTKVRPALACAYIYARRRVGVCATLTPAIAMAPLRPPGVLRPRHRSHSSILASIDTFPHFLPSSKSSRIACGIARWPRPLSSPSLHHLYMSGVPHLSLPFRSTCSLVVRSRRLWLPCGHPLGAQPHHSKLHRHARRSVEPEPGRGRRPG